jgi:hypothetical protein
MMEPAIMPPTNAPAKMSVISQPDAVTVETVSSVGPRIPGRGGSYAPRPSLSVDENSFSVDLFRCS